MFQFSARIPRINESQINLLRCQCLCQVIRRSWPENEKDNIIKDLEIETFGNECIQIQESSQTRINLTYQYLANSRN